MKCIICGNKEAVIDGMCPDCFLNNKRFVNPPKKVELSVCPRCGAVKIGNSWSYDLTRNQGIERILSKDTGLRDDRVNFSTGWKILEKQNLLDVEYILKMDDHEKKEIFQVPLIIKIQTCPRCSKYSGDYFESILQIRPGKKLSRKEMGDLKKFVFETIRREMEKNPEFYILKEEMKDGGLDLYLSSNSSTRTISKKIAEQYGATVKESPHLAGVKEGEKFYRVTYSVRLPDYGVGDFIKSGNERFRILAIRKGQIKVINIENGDIGSLTQKDFLDRNFKVFARAEDAETAIVIFENGNEIEIMETSSYRTLVVKRPPFGIAKEVIIVRDGDSAFIVNNKV